MNNINLSEWDFFSEWVYFERMSLSWAKIIFITTTTDVVYRIETIPSTLSCKSNMCACMCILTQLQWKYVVYCDTNKSFEEIPAKRI